jgi:hypothetical protein
MPAMKMPENHIEAVEGMVGSHETDALSTMAGEWQIETRNKKKSGYNHKSVLHLNYHWVVAGRGLFALLIIFLLETLAACIGSPPPIQLTQTVGALSATLNVMPYPPVPMQDVMLELTLQDNGQPIRNAIVHLTLTMPDCTMAPSYPEATEVQPGLYQARTILTMAGAWQAEAEISFNEQKENFTFFFATK